MEATPTLTDLWAGLTHAQRRYVVARQTHPNKAAAAEAVGLHRRTPYEWPPEVEQAVETMVTNTADLAMGELRRAVLRATLAKIAELDSPDPHIAARAASEILDRALGKATQRNETKMDARVEVSPQRIEEIRAAILRRAMEIGSEAEQAEQAEVDAESARCRAASTSWTA